MTKPLGYLASAKNVVGCVAAATGSALALGTGFAGDFWPAVPVVAYGLGAVLTPRDKKSIAPSPSDTSHDWSAEELKEKLSQANAAAPTELALPMSRINRIVYQILSRWADMENAPKAKFDVAATIIDYIPTTLSAYSRIPVDRRHAPDEDGKVPAQVVSEQLSTIEGHLEVVRTALYDSDMAALEAQSRFLGDRFGRRPSLDM